MEFLTWAQQVLNQSIHLIPENQAKINLSFQMILSSSFVTLLYFATWSRSKLYALAFLFVSVYEVCIFNALIDKNEYYAFQYFILLTSLQCFLFAYCLSKTNSKSQRFVCVMIITIDLLMALGYLTGGKSALYLYDNYENIVFCLHVMLILSLYKPKPILSAMADKLRDFLRALDSVIFMRGIWYTTSIAKTRLVTL